MMVDEIILKNDVKLLVEKRELEGRIEVMFHLGSAENCLLHWGLSRNPGAPWHIPPEPVRPEGSREFDRTAVQTPFTRNNGDGLVSITLDRHMDFSDIVFTLFYPDTGKWDNNHGENYRIGLPVIKRESPLPSTFKEEAEGREIMFEKSYPLADDYSLSVRVSRDDGCYEILLLSDMPEPLVLHWGVALKSRYEWLMPPAAIRPSGSVVYDDRAVRSPFVLRDRLNRLDIRIDDGDAPSGICFLLYAAEGDRWLKNRNKDFFLPVLSAREEEYPGLSGLTEEIIHGETGDHGWTLMHRFNLCHDLIDSVVNDIEGLAMIYVWMRFSELRQLDWQRRYNTKPKELSHAQDRLSLKVADAYIRGPEGREVLRMIMSTLGRGGEGQRIRDEILHIMHRRHIKEVAGHFLEEWHQKLHNNTTPDDIVICEAYIEFLRSDGDLDLFYSTLEAGGVTRERLESFERPIVVQPDFIPHLKDALIYDFGNYLKLLKSIHSGTDLESAINAARYLLDRETGALLEFIWRHRDTGDIGTADYIERITRARRILNDRINAENDCGRVRDMLFLDLSLEGFMRVVIERTIHKRLDGDELVDLTGMVFDHIRFSYDNNELSACSREWAHIQGLPRFSRDWSLHAKAVLERVGRAAGLYVDRCYTRFQSKADFLGKAFKADPWTINLFTEEVVRGMPAFVLSMLLRHLEPLLRKYAKLGDWQVISPGRTLGRLEVEESLGSIQGRNYERPSIIFAEKVRGDEEPPEGVTAIITPDTVDLVSHISVRARNAHMLFATCYDEACIQRLKALRGHMLDLSVTVSGDVEFEEAEEGAASMPSRVEFTYEKKSLPEFSSYVISSRDFNDHLVGGKSNNLKSLENKLPDWIHLPVSAALPFGIFEKVSALEINREAAGRCSELFSRINGNAEEVLSEIRSAILGLSAPEDLRPALLEVMENSGFDRPERMDDIWMCIKRVWASKWNERAYLSRNARRIAHDDIFMAVLIQQVIDAEYAFVIHTVNPSTNDMNELYTEVVPGLGETLVGNYPGRALGFVSRKDSPEYNILSYPSKSSGLFGGGLIFRSDSNAEDLHGYAGAGLYDSVMLDQPREVSLDYTQDPLTWDEHFKGKLIDMVTKIGIEVEKRFGFPQDIEGVYSNGKYYVVQTRPQVGIF